MNHEVHEEHEEKSILCHPVPERDPSSGKGSMQLLDTAAPTTAKMPTA